MAMIMLISRLLTCAPERASNDREATQFSACCCVAPATCAFTALRFARPVTQLMMSGAAGSLQQHIT